MTANVGSTDKVIRFALALAAVVGAYVAGFTTVAGILLLVVGAVLAVTAVTGFCPIYRALGMSTCPTRR
jgi:Protein of unknown function (DUF2892)